MRHGDRLPSDDNWPVIAQALDNVGARLQAQYAREGIPWEMIVQGAQTLGHPKSSVLPSDYCYNLINRSGCSFRYHLFERRERGRYRYLGRNYPYTGTIWWQPRGGRKQKVGKWTEGEYQLDLDPRAHP